MTNPTEFELDDTTRGYIGELNQQIQIAANSMNGALALVCRQNRLAGQWRLHSDGTKLIRTDAPEPEPTVNGTIAASPARADSTSNTRPNGMN